nr:putative RNA-directed DNA polymerase, eukaryota [Tanacetum cinerariifolium]
MPKKAGGVKKDTGVNEVGNSYVHVVKGQMQPGNKESEATPALVLSDECLLSKDLSKSLFGRVKQFALLANIRKADSMKLFQDNVSIGSWFSQLKKASMEFNTEGRIAWVEVEGIPFKLWSDNTFKRIATTAFWIRAKEAPRWVPDFLEENDDEEQNDDGDFNVHESSSCGGDSDVEGVLETIFEESFTPKEGTHVVGMHAEESRSDNIVNLSDHNTEEVNNTFSGNCPKKNSKDNVSNSVCSGHFKTSMVPRTGGSILSLMGKLVNVGQVMGYKMDGCLAQKAKKDWVKELCVKNKVNFLALQETKMENVELFSVKMCWGNFVFDYVHSDSVGNSRGILCVWDPNSFHKSNATVSDYFIMIRVMWRQTGNDLLIITVYAPHDLKDKQMLWDYLTYEIGANAFNSFITNAGLEEVPLGGISFTWCHKSATKMSKLDRFLIYENLLNTCPNITTITLERYLSDHQPILLRESHFDYGPTPFRFFHHWIELEGFSKVVEDAWREGPCDESNAMIKLKHTKTKIRECNKKNMLSTKNVKAKYKDELEDLEAIINKGYEMAQKVKVKWSIEGDENTSFFHGMLNKKRSLLNIRGIMADGMWIESPNRVKGEFFHHFSSRFDKPDARRAHIEMRYLKTLTCDQQVELESDVSNEEIKRAVWDCGIDKSLGPDGFTFGLYRRFWNLIENDVYDAIKYFFTYGVIPKGCNSSFIALILKIPDANTIKDFKPISLIGSLYKIVAKILANRLVGVLGDIVNEVQSAFIAGRQILDGPFILNEVLQWCKIKKKQSLIFKVDFEKAYDSVRWDFLDDILNFFGFGEKWCKCIQSCLRSSKELFERIFGLKTSLDSSFRRVLRGGVEQEQFDELSALVHDVTLTPMSDRWIWALESSGDFSNASVRKVIDDKSLPEVDSKTRWIKYVLIKVNVHAWKVKTDSLPTRFNVSRRGIHIDSIMCAICDKGAKTSSHLFFSCCMARQTVRMITRWWDAPYGEAESYDD